jgi:hypothetical protein
MKRPPTIELIVIRGDFLRVFSQAAGNGISFDTHEMDHAFYNDSPLPTTYLLIEEIDPEKEVVKVKLKGFTESEIILKDHKAVKIETSNAESIIVGFNHVRTKY